MINLKDLNDIENKINEKFKKYDRIATIFYWIIFIIIEVTFIITKNKTFLVVPIFLTSFYIISSILYFSFRIKIGDIILKKKFELIEKEFNNYDI